MNKIRAAWSVSQINAAVARMWGKLICIELDQGTGLMNKLAVYIYVLVMPVAIVVSGEIARTQKG